MSSDEYSLDRILKLVWSGICFVLALGLQEGYNRGCGNLSKPEWRQQIPVGVFAGTGVMKLEQKQRHLWVQWERKEAARQIRGRR